jgi:hypothetical protein
VIFGGQEILCRLLTEGVAGAQRSVTPLDAIGAALAAVDPVFDAQRLELARQRQAIVAVNVDLQERELLKGAMLTAAIADGFRERGLADSMVQVAAELGHLALRMTFARWVAQGNERTFIDMAQEVVAELTTATAALDQRFG